MLAVVHKLYQNLEDEPQQVAEEPKKVYDTPSLYMTIKSTPGIPSGVKEVLAQVCNMAYYGKDKCYHAHLDKLAKDTGLHRTKISKHLKRLVEAGLLTVEGDKRTCRSYKPSEELLTSLHLFVASPGNEVARTSLHSVTKVRYTVSPTSLHSVTKNSNKEKAKSKEHFTDDFEQRYLSACADLEATRLELAELKNLLAEKEQEIEALKAKKKTKKLAAPKLSDPDSSAPLVKCYADWYKAKANVEPSFNGRDGVAGKELFIYLRNQSKNKDSAGAVAGMMYVFEHWHMVDSLIRKQTRLYQIHLNISAIMVQIAEGRKTAKQLEAQRAEREQAAPPTKPSNPLAIPQSPDAFQHRLTPKAQAAEEKAEQERRAALLASRTAKVQADEQRQTT